MMKTFSQTRITLLDILAQLKCLEGPGAITQAMHTLKAREVGRLCYQAEEDLLSPELALLRDMLDIKSRAWEAYKHACLEGFYP